YYGNDKVTANSTDDRELYRHAGNKDSKSQQQIHLYSVTSEELLSIDIGKATPSALTWSDSDSSLYFAAQSTESTEDADRLYEAEWKDVIQYRRRKPNYGSVIQLRLNNENFLSVQGRLYSIDLTNGQIEQWGKGFQGSVRDYTIRSEGGVFILGQLGTNVHVYTQLSVLENVCLLSGWHGSYRSISSSKSKQYSSVAVTYSSFEQPEEVYFTKHIDELPWAKPLTHENQLLSTRDLPRTKLYRWSNPEDNRTIEGILHYPPGKFEHKNLPLFVLMHGGPTGASLNQLQPSFDTWAPLAATEGWLVLEPNFRGSTGYGDKFIDEVLCEMLSRTGKDILTGVNSLVNDGIVDPTRLNIGGYSFGGFLTNWLITQTTLFSAAVSGAEASELVSMWGTTDFPTYGASFMCGFPWEVPEIYKKESAMNNLNKAQTPILITTGAKETRVPADQSYMLERGLTYLGVPVKLLLFPDEGHAFSSNPWHGKIKVREELKWLAQYDHLRSVGAEDVL
ncbi:unnamed protein product, partial [Rotaria magnacalcarata]